MGLWNTSAHSGSPRSLVLGKHERDLGTVGACAETSTALQDGSYFFPVGQNLGSG